MPTGTSSAPFITQYAVGMAEKVVRSGSDPGKKEDEKKKKEDTLAKAEENIASVKQTLAALDDLNKRWEVSNHGNCT